MTKFWVFHLPRVDQRMVHDFVDHVDALQFFTRLIPSFNYEVDWAVVVEESDRVFMILESYGKYPPRPPMRNDFEQWIIEDALTAP